MHIRPKLKPHEARRVLYCVLFAAVAAEAAIAVHAATVHDVVTSGLVVTAWARESIVGLIEHIAEVSA